MLAQWRRTIAAVCCLLGMATVGAEERGAAELPPIAIIIDDLGDRLTAGVSAISLPGEVTYAVLPQTTYSRRLAELAHAAGKEVMLHQPMQALDGKRMGPGGMDIDMTRQALSDTLKANLDSVPHARGVNNHMGSLLTRHPGQMAWLMEALQTQGNLYFVDSTTTSDSVARRVAHEHALPSLRRHVFLDHHRDEQLILKEFVRTVQIARGYGYGVAIGHPYPKTLEVLKRVLPHLEQFGVRLVPVSELISEINQRREQQWQASLSPLHKGVKSSKQ